MRTGRGWYPFAMRGHCERPDESGRTGGVGNGAWGVSEWNDLPTDVQRRLVEHATSGESDGHARHREPHQVASGPRSRVPVRRATTLSRDIAMLAEPPSGRQTSTRLGSISMMLVTLLGLIASSPGSG